MELAFALPLINTSYRQAVHRNFLAAESEEMLGQCFACYFIECHAANAGGSAGKVMIYYFGIESDDLKYLCTLVRLQGGDTHFGEDFEQSFIYCFHIVFLELIRLQCSVDLTTEFHIADAG